MNITPHPKVSGSPANRKSPEILYLCREDLVRLGGLESQVYTQTIRDVLTVHAAGDFVQPLKPYLRVNGEDGHIADRLIAMPAYIGDPRISGLKWIGSKHDNPSRNGLERASALIVLNDPASNYPIAVMEGGLISGMRTAAVTVVAAQHLARKGFGTVACVGCGAIARMQLSSLLEHFAHISSVHLFDSNLEAAELLAAELTERFPGVQVRVTETAEHAVREGEVVVTCTVTDRPYIPADWLREGVFVSNISIMDVCKEAFLEVDKLVVDDWEQSNREKKIINQLVEEGLLSRDGLHAELGEIVSGCKPGRESDGERILLNPMGMAIEDIACAKAFYDRAINSGVGTRLSLY
jgi:ornithine cyclodeaminase